MMRIFAILLFISLVAWMNPEADKAKDGNRLYNKELYDDAMTKYTEVLVELPNSPRLHFNIGNAAYKKENYEEAIKSYTRAATLASDPALENKAYYNLGNCAYRQGRLKENTDLGETIKLYQEALEYYRQAIEKYPKDSNDAKYNHEFVERKLKELLDQQKQEGEPQEQQQEGEQQEGEQQEGEQQQGEQQQGQQGEQTEEEEQEGQEGQQEEEDESEAEEKKAGQAESQEKESQEEKQQQEQESQQKEGLTKKEAKMLLDSLKDEELHRPDNRNIERRIPRVLKDW